MFTVLCIGWICAALVMSGLWYYQQIRRDATVVDVAWSGGLGLMALAFAYYGTGSIQNRILLGFIAGTWSLRLFLYLLISRVVGHRAEDGRYAALREKWGTRAAWNFFLFFQFQAFLIALFAIPFVPVSSNPTESWTLWTVAAVVIAVLAISGESLADAQLANWRRDPGNKGRTCQNGLWKYSRHPNYFFEWLHWWSYVFLAIGSDFAWLALSGPLIMLLFLYRITGIPYTEQQALRSRADYALYQQEVSAFIPWFPRRKN